VVVRPGVTYIGVVWAFLRVHTITAAMGVRVLLNLMLTLTLFMLWRSWRVHRGRLETVKRNAIHIDERSGYSRDQSGP
jgi:hypothetical protein